MKHNTTLHHTTPHHTTLHHTNVQYYSSMPFETVLPHHRPLNRSLQSLNSFVHPSFRPIIRPSLFFYRLVDVKKQERI